MEREKRQVEAFLAAPPIDEASVEAQADDYAILTALSLWQPTVVKTTRLAFEFRLGGSVYEAAFDTEGRAVTGARFSKTDGGAVSAFDGLVAAANLAAIADDVTCTADLGEALDDIGLEMSRLSRSIGA